MLNKYIFKEKIKFDKMGNLGTFFGGLSGKKKEDFNDGNSHFITYKNIYDNLSVDLSSPEKVMIYPDENQRKIQYGDVLFTGSSETREESAFSSVVTKYPKEDYYLNSFCFIWRMFNNEIFNLDFLKYLLRSNYMRKQFIKTANGVTRYNVSKKCMEDVLIPIPPIETQNEIVEILDKYTFAKNELIKELNSEKNINYKMYMYLYSNILNNDSKEKIKLKDLFDLKNGYTPSKSIFQNWENGTISWFKMDDIRKNGKILYDSINKVNEIAVKKSLFSKDSIIISTSATIGEYALIKKDFICNQRFTCMSLKEKYKSNYLIEYLFYYCEVLSDFCKENVNKGNFASVDMKKFREFEFPIISIEQQKEKIKLLNRLNVWYNSQKEIICKEKELIEQQYNYYMNNLLTYDE